MDELSCRLGRWLSNDETRNSFGKMPAFGKIATPHAHVHQNMHQALDLMGHGWENDYDIQTSLFAAFKAVEHGSDGVIAALDEVVREKHGERR